MRQNMKHRIPVMSIVIFSLCAQIIMGENTATYQEASPMNVTDCQEKFVGQGKIYLAEYYDYIMKTSTMDIIEDKDGGTLNTTALEKLMLNSDGEFRSPNIDESFDPNFPNYTTVLPKNLMSLFSNYSCRYLKTGGVMESYCKHPENSEYPSQGLIYLKNNSTSKAEKRVVVAGLCDSFQSEWSDIIVNAIKQYLGSDLVKELSEEKDASTGQLVNAATEEKSTKKKTFLIVLAVLLGVLAVAVFAGGIISIMGKRQKKNLPSGNQPEKLTDYSEFMLTPPLSPDNYSSDEFHHEEMLPNIGSFSLQRGNSCIIRSVSCSSVSTDEANAIEMVIVKSNPGVNDGINDIDSEAAEPDEKEASQLYGAERSQDAAMVDASVKELSKVPTTNDTKLPAKTFVQGIMKKKSQGNWATARDKESGEVYYYNKTSRKTTWDRPASFDSEVDE